MRPPPVKRPPPLTCPTTARSRTGRFRPWRSARRTVSAGEQPDTRQLYATDQAAVKANKSTLAAAEPALKAFQRPARTLPLGAGKRKQGRKKRDITRLSRPRSPLFSALGRNGVCMYSRVGSQGGPSPEQPTGRDV